MHMIKIVKCQLIQCHLNQAAACHFKLKFDLSESARILDPTFLSEYTLAELLLVGQVSLPTSYYSCSKKLEYPSSSASWTETSSRNDSVSWFEGFWQTPCCCEHLKSLIEGQWFFFFFLQRLHSTTTVQKCNSSSPGHLWSAQIQQDPSFDESVSGAQGGLIFQGPGEYVPYDFWVGRGRLNSKMCGSGWWIM